MFLFGGIFGIVGFILGLTGGTEAEFTMMQTFSAGVVMPFVTYYCRKWSREWNEKFEEIYKRIGTLEDRSDQFDTTLTNF